MDTSIKPYQDLAESIILQAVKDYKNALKAKPSILTRRTICECERFFKSQWFCVLNNADGEMIMDKIKKEVLDESSTHTANT